MDNKGEIIIFENPEKSLEVQVKLENESLWLTQRLMAELFEKDTDTIGLHLKNIYNEQELEESATTEFFSVVQNEGKRKVKRNVKFYNLDAIISVGYRVNSKRGTQFRQWATQRLKEHLIKGYTINEKRLKETESKLTEFKKTVFLLDTIATTRQLSSDESQGLFKILKDYTYALDILDKYDHGKLEQPKDGAKEVSSISYDEAINAIKSLKSKFGGSSLFAKEKDESFKSSLATIYQTFDGQELYPSVEEKASQLLYLITKNHSFIDGNKRIAAFLFIWFLEKNNILYLPNGNKIIDDKALIALTLMIAESTPEDKNIMTKLCANLLIKK